MFESKSSSARILRIVISSPGDVQPERDCLLHVVDELNRGVAADRNLRIEVIRWETDAYPGFSPEGPQGLIDSVLRIEDCDVLIGIFWKRFGTPVANTQSGTEHEFRIAYAAWTQTGRPQIMVYFKQNPYKLKAKEDAEQWAKVLDFQRSFPKEGLWWSFNGTTQFERLVRSHLTRLIRQQFPLLTTNSSSIEDASQTKRTPPAANKSKVNLVFLYSHQDAQLRNQLATHLSVLKQQGVIKSWKERRIMGSEESDKSINESLEAAHVVLLLLSADFIASDFCYSAGMKSLLERHHRGELRVIPVILRPIDWVNMPFGNLQSMPQDGKPVTSWRNPDEAWLDISKSIGRVCEEIDLSEALSTTQLNKRTADKQVESVKRLHDVFFKAGVPDITFIEPPDFDRLINALITPGRGIVIEGPSGIGKTTALRKAVQQLSDDTLFSKLICSGDGHFPILSARNPKHVEEIKSLRQLHQGVVAIDDFHRLDSRLSTEIVDYLKDLADNEDTSKKLIIVGIPGSGQTLVDASFDVATRIEFLKLGKVPIDLILTMIEKGELALNIRFDSKTEIALAAGGSLNIAQYLCFHICEWEKLLKTQQQTVSVVCNVTAAVSQVMSVLTKKFGESIRRFAVMGGPRDSTCLRLLEELSRSDDGLLPLTQLKDTKPEIAPGIAKFIHSGWMEQLYADYPPCSNHLFYNTQYSTLVVDDPQLMFYLAKISYSQLAREAGKSPTKDRHRIFISYSHRDSKWIERLQVHLRPLVRDGIIDPWSDNRIAPGSKWREEIQAALESATAAILLVSADFLASDFIVEHELPVLLSRARDEGTLILPVILSPCRFDSSTLSQFQSVNSPDVSLAGLNFVEQETIWRKLTEEIERRFSTT